MVINRYKKLAGIEPSGKNLHWTTDINTELPIKMKLQKINGREPFIPRTIPQVFLENAQNYTDWPSMHAELQKGKWEFWTWGECWDMSFRFAKSLLSYCTTHPNQTNTTR